MNYIDKRRRLGNEEKTSWHRKNGKKGKEKDVWTHGVGIGFAGSRKIPTTT